MTYADGKEQHYVRLAPLETAVFPHGIALATPFPTNAEAENDAYLEAALKALQGT